MNLLICYLFQIVLVLILTMELCNSMPYNVPLQGIVGGTRTLVILDDLVRFIYQYSDTYFSNKFYLFILGLYDSKLFFIF